MEKNNDLFKIFNFLDEKIIILNEMQSSLKDISDIVQNVSNKLLFYDNFITRIKDVISQIISQIENIITN